MANQNQHQIVPLSPYYLHPNENPSLVLVQPPLSGNNYHSWSRSMRMALMSKNKLAFVTGNLTAPPANDPDFHAWEQCNSMVLSWILNSVSASIAQSVMWLNSAREVWNDLKERFSHGDYFRLSDLLEELNTVRQGELTVTDFFTKLKILWEELLVIKPFPTCTCEIPCSCGAVRVYRDYFEAECVIRFLKGLNEHFAPVRAQVLLMNPLPSINQVFGMAIKHERQLSYCVGHSEHADNPIMAVPGSINGKQVSYGSYSNFGGSVQYPKRPLSGNRNFQCNYCGIQGHTEDRCYRKHGFPPGGRGRGRGYGRGGRATVNQVEAEQVHDMEIQESPVPFTQEQLDHLTNMMRMSQRPVQKEEPEHVVNQAAVLSANFEAPGNYGSFDQEADWLS